jgi:acyl-coenzyme A synthetase/AMP-(fatty) acid ligase
MEGYWNDSWKTKSVLLGSFPHAKGKVYRTGDFVIRNKNGNLEYHGRRDGMIKIKGYRIELGEIEAALCLHKKIKEAVVIGIPDEKTGKKIKAFVVPKAAKIITGNEVKLFCLRHLPLYMVPESIVLKNNLPRVSTGKIDRKKLESEAGCRA